MNFWRKLWARITGANYSFSSTTSVRKGTITRKTTINGKSETVTRQMTDKDHIEFGKIFVAMQKLHKKAMDSFK